MIKGLYFKLNLENERDKRIYDFFNVIPKLWNVDKIEILDELISNFNVDQGDKNV